MDQPFLDVIGCNTSDWIGRPLGWPLGCRKRQSKMLLERYPRVFNQKLGTMGHFEAALRLSKDAKPVFCKARSVPFTLKEVVGRDLDRLEKEGILVKVSSSE